MARLTHRTAPGWTYFVTTKAAQNIAVFQVREISEIVISKMLEYRSKENYLLHEFVLMPDPVSGLAVDVGAEAPTPESPDTSTHTKNLQSSVEGRQA